MIANYMLRPIRNCHFLPPQSPGLKHSHPTMSRAAMKMSVGTIYELPSYRSPQQNPEILWFSNTSPSVVSYHAGLMLVLAKKMIQSSGSFWSYDAGILSDSMSNVA